MTVKDANGCIANKSIVITQPSAALSASYTQTNVSCQGENNGAFKVNVSGGTSPYRYTLNGTTGTTGTFNSLAPGNYIVTVTDANECTTTTNANVITNPLPSIFNVTGGGTYCANGSGVPVGLSGSESGVSYQLQNNGSNIGGPVAGTGSVLSFGMQTAAGTYTVVAANASTTCSSAMTGSASVSINPLPSLFSVTGGGVYCAGTAGAPVGLSGSEAGVNYQLQNNGSNIGTIVAGTGSAISFGLQQPAGTYSVVATNSFLCSVTMTGNVTVTPTPALTGTAVITQAYTCLATGTVQAQTVAGGTAPYQYSIDGTTFGSSDTFTGLTNGTYAITVKDASGCTFVTNSVTLDALNPPTDLSFASTSVTCPALTSDVTVSVVNGNAPFTYEITAPAAVNNGTQNVFAGLAPGTYTFKVTDSKGCTFTESYTINAIVPIDVTAQLIENVSCKGGTDGEVRFTVGGFTGTYSYSVNGGAAVTGQSAATITLSGKSAGSYAITVTDETTNCTDAATIDIEEPATALSLTANVQAITCVSNGSVTAVAAGGWGGNQYSLLNPDGTTTGPQAGTQFTGLSQAGAYTLSVTDANGCVVTANFTLSTPVPPTASIDAASDLCFDSGNLATIVVGVTGGVSPYTYSINGASAVNSNTFANLTPGTYTITVTDAYGCTTTLTQEIKAQLTATATLTKELDCSASPDAVINVGVTGGYATYTYEVSVNGGASVSASLPYTASTPGTYQFFVTDSKGCTATSNIITVTTATPPKITSVTQTQSILCNGDAGAAFQIVLDNTQGTSPFNISVNGVSYGTQTLISGLPAGTYNILVTDARSCTDTESITILQPNALNATATAEAISCVSGNIPGSITVTNSGGTAPYDYYLYDDNNVLVTPASMNNASLTYVVPNLNFGDYYAVIVDANGCQQRIGPIRVTSLVDLDVDISTVTSNCVTGGTVRVSVPDGIGVGPFKFRVFPNGAYVDPDITAPRSHNFTGLTPGVIYTFEVIDMNTGCTYAEEASGPVSTSSSLTSTVTPVPVTCKGASDGRVNFTFSGWGGSTTLVGYKVYASGTYPSDSPAPLIKSGTVSVGDAQPIAVTGLAPGSYYILLTENGTGCSVQTVEFNITKSQNNLALAVTATNDNCKANAGVITATAQFGTGPYTFQFEDFLEPFSRHIAQIIHITQITAMDL